MDFFCLPIIFGCSTKLTPEGDASPRLCPRCNNNSVFQAKSRTWFDLCWIPLIPMSAKHIWQCGICHWSVPLQQGWEPALPGQFYQHGGQYFVQSPPAAWHGGQQGYSGHQANV